MVFQINADFAHGALSIGGPASEWWVQLSSAVVWGLGFATLLTLVLTPVMLSVPSRMGNWRRRKLAWLDNKRREIMGLPPLADAPAAGSAAG